jgi:hypothetical protein
MDANTTTGRLSSRNACIGMEVDGDSESFVLSFLPPTSSMLDFYSLRTRYIFYSDRLSVWAAATSTVAFSMLLSLSLLLH